MDALAPAAALDLDTQVFTGSFFPADRAERAESSMREFRAYLRGLIRERRAAEGTKHVDQNPRIEPPPPPPLSPMVNDLRTLYSPQRRFSSLSAAEYFSSRSRPTVVSIRCRPA